MSAIWSDVAFFFFLSVACVCCAYCEHDKREVERVRIVHQGKCQRATP